MVRIPKSIGPYRILDRLGLGGMSVVYRAEPLAGGQRVALKTVSVPRRESLQALRREIHALARLQHPGIVSILDEGLHRGRPWYAMELLQGSSLRDFLTSSPAGERLQQGLGLLRRLCAALGFLHGEGLVHRDLKPENVWLRPDAQPVLMDFGIVSRFGGELARDQLEPAGRPSGTLAYMSPEQLRGELCNARADLYSLGCLLYELGTGRPPFLGPGWMRVLRQHLEAQPEPPARLAPGLSAALESLILQLLSKDPRKRPGYASDVAAVLAEVQRACGHLESDAEPMPRARAYLYRPRFVGRDEPMRQLLQGLGRAEEGRGGLVLLGGESGAGKTRLLLELAGEAHARGLHVLAGECLPGPSMPLQALRRPLLLLADLCRERGAAETERLLGPRAAILAAYEPGLGALQPVRTGADLSLPAEEARLRLFDALAETFAQLARPGGTGSAAVVLLLDDLQWADELTLGFLQFLASGADLGQRRILLVGAYRTGEVTQSPALQRLLQAEASAKDARPLQLGRLERTAVASIVADMLSMPAPPEPFVASLARRSQGNAFFLAEYLRTAIASEVLYRTSDGSWQIVEAGSEATNPALLEALPLPDAVRGLVEQRLAGLSPLARRQAEAAAVLGREMEETLTGRVAWLGRLRWMEALQELVAREVLQEAGPGRLRFVHDQIREVAYDGIPEARRRRLHRAAARVIGAAGREQDLASVAGHHLAAGEPDLARPLYLQAARRARSIHALSEAEGLYQAYLTLVLTPRPESIRARNELALQVLFGQGKNALAFTELGLALDEAVGCSDDVGQQEVWANRCEMEWQLGRPSDETARQALELAKRCGDPSREHRALIATARIAADLGQAAEAEALLLGVLEQLRTSGDRLQEIQAVTSLGILYRRQERVADAVDLFGQGVSLARRLGRRYDEGRILSNLAGVHVNHGDLGQGLALMHQALQIHREVGNLRSEALLLMNLGRLHWREGNVPEAGPVLEQCLALARKIGQAPLEGGALRVIAELELLGHGNVDRAEQLILQAQAVFEAAGARIQVALCRCQLGHVQLARGGSARPLLSQLQALAVELGASWLDLTGALDDLRRALEAFEAGSGLYRGWAWDAIYPGVQRWLVRPRDQ